MKSNVCILSFVMLAMSSCGKPGAPVSGIYSMSSTIQQQTCAPNQQITFTDVQLPYSRWSPDGAFSVMVPRGNLMERVDFYNDRFSSSREIQAGNPNCGTAQLTRSIVVDDKTQSSFTIRDTAELKNVPDSTGDCFGAFPMQDCVSTSLIIYSLVQACEEPCEIKGGGLTLEPLTCECD